jgi:hypothetical protein
MLPMNTAKRDRRNGFYCAVILLIAAALTRPYGESGVNDDWSYTKTALDLAQTGQLRYNGWAAAMLGAQAYWGAAFIKVFGFSFLVTRLSTLPLAAGCALLLYALHRRAQLSAALSIFGTLTVTLSPLFVPHAVTFMTEVPAFFLLLLSIFYYARAIDEKEREDTPSDPNRSTRPRLIIWLLAATISGLLAGTIRQAYWVLPILAPLYLIGRQQKKASSTRDTFVLVSLSVVSFAIAAGCATWFYHQPYAIHERLNDAFLALRDAQAPLLLLKHILHTWLTLAALMLPVVVAASCSYVLIFARQRLSMAFAAVCILLAGVATFLECQYDPAWSFPWLPNTFTITPYLNGTMPVPPGAVGINFSWSFWHAFSVVVMILAFTAAAVGLLKGAWPPRSKGHLLNLIQNVSTPLGIFSFFAAGYLPLLLLKSVVPGGGGLFDRYLLPIIPLATIIGLRIYSVKTGKTKPPQLGWIALALAAYYAVAQTHDYFALLRARLKLTNALEAHGIPRHKIMGGFEYDGWTQITEVGYCNDPRIQDPPIQYVPPKPLAFQTDYYLWQITTVVQPEYVVCLAAHPDLITTDLHPITYRAWLPPFSRRCLVQTTVPSLASVSVLPLRQKN